MTRLLAQMFENRIQQRVFELLRNDRALKIQITAGLTEPLKIAVMIAGDEDAALRAITLRFFKIFQLDIFGEILGREARAPQKIEHCAREMLKRFADDSFALDRSES